MTSFDIIVPTIKTREEYIKTNCYNCLNEICDAWSKELKIDIKYHFENRKGLSELYQEELDSTKSDYVICMHDDLEVHDFYIFKKLLKAHTLYDIVGLAGATSQDYTRNDVPMVWHLTRESSEHGRGIVSHYIPKGFNNVSEPHINSSYFGPTPGSVVVIDGLFMSFKMSSIKNIKLFDPMFTFHHYDMAACVNASIHNLTIGVWPIYCLHYGLGEFANDDIWKDHAVKFKNKFGDYKTKI